MKQLLKKILPKPIVDNLRKIILPITPEYKWVKYTSKNLKGKIKKEITITTNGEIYLKSDFGFDFLLNDKEERLTLDTFDDKGFEFLLNHLKDKIQDNSSILDIGAFMGGFSLAISCYFPKVKIYCFEPVKSSFNNILKNLDRNKNSNVTPYQMAISDAEGEVTMTSDLTTGNHILSNTKNSLNVEQVKCTDVDSFVTKNNIENISFIKCDVEGHEMAMIKGAQKTIEKYKPVIYIEIQDSWTERYNTTGLDVINEILKFGYKIYSLSPNSIKEIKDVSVSLKDHENFLFIH